MIMRTVKANFNYNNSVAIRKRILEAASSLTPGATANLVSSASSTDPVHFET
jgi:hypothetical protein